MGDSPFTMENEVFAGLVYYGTLLMLKVLLMAPLTAVFRFKNGSFGNAEDAAQQAGGDAEKLKKMLVPNEDVERVRRAHRNDLENVLPFMLLAVLYCATGPDAATALLHFKIFFYARVAHSVVYVLALQPWRALCWMVGMVVCLSMVYSTLVSL